MALVKAHHAVDLLAQEVALATVDGVVKYLDDNGVELDEDTQKLLDDFKEQLKKDYKPAAKGRGGKVPGAPKKTRAPTEHNLFIRETMARLKPLNPSLNGKELMALANQEWKKQKGGDSVAAPDAGAGPSSPKEAPAPAKGKGKAAK